MTRNFHFYPEDHADARLSDTAPKITRCRLGGLFAQGLCNTWISPPDAIRQLLSTIHSIDIAMSTAEEKFPGNTDVSTMFRQWAIDAAKMRECCTRLLSEPGDEIDLLAIAGWLILLVIRQQTLELNDINMPRPV